MNVCEIWFFFISLIKICMIGFWQWCENLRIFITVELFSQITNYKYQEHLKSLIHHDYGISMDETKNQKVTKLIDKMQFYVSWT